MERSTDSNSRWIAACCGVIIAALYVVAFVSKTELRHLVQTVPLWLGVVLALLGVRVAKWVVLPILLFWLAAMTFIWLFLLGGLSENVTEWAYLVAVMIRRTA